MTEFQRLFFVQARSGFAVFILMRNNRMLPPCHALHYLQMATEMLGKAYAWRQGPRTHTHAAFVGFLRGVISNREAQKQLGFKGRNTNWRNMIHKCVPLAERVELLAPALSLDGPNPEYPWPRTAPECAPAEYRFELWKDLDAPAGRRFLNLLGKLFESAEVFL